MLKYICAECDSPCEPRITETWWESGFPGRFKLVDTVSSCCSADYRPMTDDEQEEQWQADARKTRTREQQARVYGDLPFTDEPIEED